MISKEVMILPVVPGMILAVKVKQFQDKTMNQYLPMALASILLSGCIESQPPLAPKQKTTDKIGEFDPNAGDEVVKPEVKMTNPITGPLEAYHPMVQKLAALGIEHAVNLFHALEGRYPNSYDEFMTRIIEENKMRLPVLTPGLEYQYDVENHKLLVIRTPDAKTP